MRDLCSCAASKAIIFLLFIEQRFLSLAAIGMTEYLLCEKQRAVREPPLRFIRVIITAYAILRFAQKDTRRGRRPDVPFLRVKKTTPTVYIAHKADRCHPDTQ